MRRIFGGIAVIGALGLALPAAAQSQLADAQGGLLYAGPAAGALAPASDTDRVGRAGTPPVVAAAPSARSGAQPPSGEPEFVLASIDATPFARASVARPRDSASVTGYALRVLEVVNEYRQRNGLAPLRIAEDLGSIAAVHSVQMAERRRISHDGFRQRFDRTTSKICVENVGVNYPLPEAQVDGWRASPGHDRNLLEPRITRVGIANTKSFVTFFACS